jgi:quercetin dioxygenase-like cupin family protein
MYSKASLNEVDTREIEGIQPKLKAVGYELQPEKMRPSVWLFDEGESNDRHWQREQEELYYVMEGSVLIEVNDEEVELAEGDFVVVSPHAWRQITALETSTIFAIGVPNVNDDAVTNKELPS